MVVRPTSVDRDHRMVWETSVYRTAAGMVFRVSQGGEGYRRVEILTESDWIKAQPGIVGLRVRPDTVRLTAREVRELPASEGEDER